MLSFVFFLADLLLDVFACYGFLKPLLVHMMDTAPQTQTRTQACGEGGGGGDGGGGLLL